MVFDSPLPAKLDPLAGLLLASGAGLRASRRHAVLPAGELLPRLGCGASAGASEGWRCTAAAVRVDTAASDFAPCAYRTPAKRRGRRGPC